MRTMVNSIAAALIVSQMSAANRSAPFALEREIEPATKPRPFQPFLGNIDLLGKSHGKRTSKRSRQRTGDRT